MSQGAVTTVFRFEITELNRLSAHVDAVSYPRVEKAVSGGDLDTNPNRPFKLKYLKQLMQAFGIGQQDVASRNLLIDPAPDNLVLFDFDIAATGGKIKLGHYREMTQELHELDETELLTGPEKWVKHPDVKLDPGLDAADYYNEVMWWVRARVAQPIESYTEMSQHIAWPVCLGDAPEHLQSYNRGFADKHNLPLIECAPTHGVLPRMALLDRPRLLLATEQYAAEQEDPPQERILPINGKGDTASQSALGFPLVHPPRQHHLVLQRRPRQLMPPRPLLR
ncbi:hypothetical protein N0V88_007377 [Collariella sp. IMI 366227]|nr:hypothetical protein N0V88_007377 [Collariella sp. IMI 366227]